MVNVSLGYPYVIQVSGLDTVLAVNLKQPLKKTTTWLQKQRTTSLTKLLNLFSHNQHSATSDQTRIYMEVLLILPAQQVLWNSLFGNSTNDNGHSTTWSTWVLLSLLSRNHQRLLNPLFTISVLSTFSNQLVKSTSSWISCVREWAVSFLHGKHTVIHEV